MKKIVLLVFILSGFAFAEKYEFDYTEKFKREKYPFKVYKPGKDHKQILHELVEAEKRGEAEPYEDYIMFGESARFWYDPIERDIKAGQGVYSKYFGKHWCPRTTCQFIADMEMSSRLNKRISKKLDARRLAAFKGIYPYLSDYYKAFYFNAAVQYNQLEVVKSYIDQGFDPNESFKGGLIATSTEVNMDEPADGIPEKLKTSVIYVRDIKPIDVAIEYGYAEMVELLRGSGKLKE